MKVEISGKTYETDEEDFSLLTGLESQGLVLEYQCREGYCGVCRACLLRGEVCYIRKPLASLQQNEILLCSCKAKSDLEIKFY